jgi:hypothetical protein
MTRSRFVLPIVSAALAAAAMLAPTSAHAQQPPAPAAAGAAAGGTDHSQVVGSFGVGYLGLGGIAIGTLTNNGNNFTLGERNIDAPIIGVRYWLSDTLGIDAGVGFGTQSGKSTSKIDGVSNPDQEDPGAMGFLLHAGVPLVLGTPGAHHTFQVVPELNLGFGSSKVKGNGQPDTDLSGFRLDVGARAGTEIQFGFIGLPKLALQATVGLYFTSTSVGAKTDNDEFKRSSTRIGTTVQAAPWAIFTNNISALYYF